MMNKYLEKKVEVNFNELASSTFCLEYYLVESMVPNNNQIRDTVYGIEIVKKDGSNHIEKETIRNFSPNRKNTLKTINKLAYNTVTPVAMPFILDDLIGS